MGTEPQGWLYTFGYSWGWKDAGVECDALDAFVAEIEAVCIKHGIGLELERVTDEYNSTKLRLVPWKDSDPIVDLLTEDLEYVREGIPALDAAKAEFERKSEEHYAAIQAADQAKREKAAAAAARAKEEKLLRDGMAIGGKRYRLVEAP